MADAGHDRDSQPLISIVCPCLNEQEVIDRFCKTLLVVIDQPELSQFAFEVILVDDGSDDGTVDRLQQLADQDSRFQIYALTRNFGHQAALSAGLGVSRGDAIILMDSDLQHPPELIPEMLRMWRSGIDVVSAVRQRATRLPRFTR